MADFTSKKKKFVDLDGLRAYHSKLSKQIDTEIKSIDNAIDGLSSNFDSHVVDNNTKFTGIETALKTKANSSDVYTRTEIDSNLSGYIQGSVASTTDIENMMNIVKNPSAIVAPTLVGGKFNITITNNDSRSLSFYYGKEESLDKKDSSSFENMHIIDAGVTESCNTGYSGIYYVKAYADDGAESSIYTVKVTSGLPDAPGGY